MVTDHHSATCGVAVRYECVVDELLKRGHNVRVLTERHPAVAGLLARRPAVVTRHGASVRAAPFLPFGEWHSEDLHGLAAAVGPASAEEWRTLDLLAGDGSLMREVTNQVAEWLQAEAPDLVLVPTQSTLGFATSAAADRTRLHTCFHTDYPAFFTSRILNDRDRKSQLAERLHDGIAGRINACFAATPAHRTHVSTSGLPRWLPPAVLASAKPFPGGVSELASASLPDGMRAVLATARDRGMPTILFSGRLLPEKGFDLLPALIERLPEAFWLIVGEGYLGPVLPRSANVVRVPFQPPAVYRRLLEHAAAYLFLGAFDTFGIGALEAAWVGVPVVTVRGAGIVHHGDLHPYLRVVDIAVDQVVAALLDVTTLQAAGKLPPQLRHRYNWHTVAARFVEELLIHG